MRVGPLGPLVSTLADVEVNGAGFGIVAPFGEHIRPAIAAGALVEMLAE